RSLLKKMSQIFKEEKMMDLAEKSIMLAESELTAKELMLKFEEIRPELGEKGIKIHIHNFNHKTDYTFYTNEERMQFLNSTNVHVNRLIVGDEMFESILPLLINLKHASLLMRGNYDPVTDEE